jgi:hypothetical protein
MSLSQPCTSEQLPLFEDRRVLLNRGILELTRLDLEEARKSFERYKALYRREDDVHAELKLTDFLIKGFVGAPEACPDEPSYLCGFWTSFEEYVQSVGFRCENIVADIKRSFFLTYIQGLFGPKILKLNEGIKEFVDEYLGLRKAFFKEPTLELRAKLFFRAIILCDNEPVLRFIKRINFIAVRRNMKEFNGVLFSRYLKRVEARCFTSA